MNNRLLLLVLSVIFLSGCSSDNTIWREQVSNNKITNRWQQELQTDQAQSVSTLTEMIDIEALNILVDKALKNNPSLQQTLITLKSAGISLDHTEGKQLPSISYGLNMGKNKLQSGETTTSHSTDITISWELDLWQKLADQTQAAELDEAAATQDLRASKASLVANVMKSYLNLIAAQQHENVQQQRTVVLENNQNIIIERYRSGLSSLDDLETTRSNYANAMATLIQLQQTLAQDKRSLVVLIGEDIQFDDVTLPSQLPKVIIPLAQMPIETIANRPDITAALLRIEAEDARTSASYKEMLPSFNISGSYGSDTSLLLFKDPVWALLGNITAPLFNGGQLKADAKLQALKAEKAYWSYREILLTSVQEIENALSNENALQRQQMYQDQALTSAKSSEKNYQSRYRQGLADILDLLKVQQNRFDTEANLIQTQVDLLNNRINLGLALGLGVQ